MDILFLDKSKCIKGIKTVQKYEMAYPKKYKVLLHRSNWPKATEKEAKVKRKSKVKITEC